MIDALQIIRNLVAEELGQDISEITADFRFDSMESLEAVNVLLGVQNAFDLTISDEDFTGLTTVADLARFVENARAHVSA